jgi:two-component system NtrC family sensor kinase
VRWSISTKVFLGFAAVIFAFGAVSLYGIYRMDQLRDNVELVRVEVLPLTAELDVVIADLKTYEEELGRTRDRDLVRLRSYFPNFRPFDRLDDVGTRIARISQSAPISSEVKERLMAQSVRVTRLQDGPEFWLRATNRSNKEKTSTAETQSKPVTNQRHYELKARSYISALQREQFEQARLLQEELASMVRHVRTELGYVSREIRRFRSQVDRAAGRSESRALLVISVATGIALIIALMVMALVAYTLRPLRRLREGVRRVAAGDFAEVEVNTGDELGELATEFNRMSASLAERDRLLTKQHYKLLRSERLATVGKMSSHIAHEIRNPLSSIGLNTELLEEELSAASEAGNDSQSESKALIAAIRTEVDRLAGVTEQYLRFARLPKPEMESTDVNSLVTDLTSFMDQEFSAQDIGVRIQLAETLPDVRMDRDQMRQAILNLLRNAMEATEADGTVGIETGLQDNMVFIQISDDGPGIDAENIEKIFDPFFTTKPSGTGLGLPLVHHVIRDHGGDIQVESTPPNGAQFTLLLPVEDLQTKDVVNDKGTF